MREFVTETNCVVHLAGTEVVGNVECEGMRGEGQRRWVQSRSLPLLLQAWPQFNADIQFDAVCVQFVRTGVFPGLFGQEKEWLSCWDHWAAVTVHGCVWAMLHVSSAVGFAVSISRKFLHILTPFAMFLHNGTNLLRVLDEWTSVAGSAQGQAANQHGLCSQQHFCYPWNKPLAVIVSKAYHICGHNMILCTSLHGVQELGASTLMFWYTGLFPFESMPIWGSWVWLCWQPGGDRSHRSFLKCFC